MKPRFLVRASLGVISVSLLSLALTGGCSSGESGPIGEGGSDSLGGSGGKTTTSSGKSTGGTGGTGGELAATTSSSKASSSASGSMGGAGGAGGTAPCPQLTGSTDYPIEVEQNDTQGTATALTAGAKGFTGQLCPIGDTDFYSVQVPAGSTLAAKITSNGTGCPGPNKIQLLVLDSNFVTLASDINDTSTCPTLAQDSPGLEGLDGTYFLEVRNLGAMPIGPYQLDVLIQPPICGDGIGSFASGEQCDDDNIVAGDGCSPTCQLEHGKWLNETEPNDAILGANNVDTYDGAVGAISPIGDIDSFTFTVVDAGSSAVIRISDGLGNCPTGAWTPQLELFGPTGVSITSTTDGDDNGCPLLAPSVDPKTMNLAPGAYTVQVSDSDGASTQGLYVVEIHAQKPGCGDGVIQPGEQCDDGNTTAGDGCSAVCQYEADYIPETEVNDTQALANPLGTHAGFYGAISPIGDIDYFTVNVTVPGSSIFVDVGDGLGHCPSSFPDMTVKLFNPAHALVVSDDNATSTTCASITPAGYAEATGLAVGTYTVGVATTDGTDAVGRYVVKIHVSPPGCGDGVIQLGEQCDDGNTTSGDGCSATCQSEAPFEIEPNNTSALATPQWSGFSTWKGAISPQGDIDYFAFTVPTAGSVTLQTHAPDDPTSCNLDTKITLFNSMGVAAGSNDEGGVPPCSKLTKMLAAGNYTVKVTGFFDTGTYQLDLTLP